MAPLARASHASTAFKITVPYAPQEGIDAPTALPLLPGGGKIQGRDGRAYTHRNPMATLQAMERSFAEYPMVLDENHSSEYAAPNGEPSPALARMKGFALRADGSIWATQIDWTPYGLERIAQRAYVGVSPTILFDSTQATKQDGVSIEGEITTIENAGLVNEPNFVMPALHAKGSNMDEAQIKKLIEDAVAAAVAPVEKLSVQVADFGAQLTALTDNANKTQAASHAKQVKRVLDRATNAKRIAPASRAYHEKNLTTPEQLEAFEAAYLSNVSEDVVSNDRPARGTHSKDRESRSSHDKVARRLNRDMGVTDEDIKKHGAGEARDEDAEIDADLEADLD